MGIHYVYVDSHDKTTYETDSNMAVYINPHLHNIHNVQANNFFIFSNINIIKQNNNKLEVLIFSYITVTVPLRTHLSNASHKN